MSVKIIRGKRDMPELSVDTKELFEAAEEMKKLLYQCDSVTQKLDQVISCFHYQINSDGYDREVNGLITQSTNLKSTRENLASAANTLQQIAESYEQVAAPQSFWAEWKENCEKKFPTSIRNKAIGSIGKGMQRLAGTINTRTAIAKTEGENAFYMLDSTVLAKTGVLSKFGSKISTGAKIGLPIIGAVIDYKTLKENGESTKDALIKTGVHAVIGQAGGKLGTIAGLAIAEKITFSVLAAAGAGAVAGVAIGLGITVLGNMFFDRCYDELRDQKRWEACYGVETM